jgi:TetR/AcrR family transcriptional repressor of nem operon
METSEQTAFTGKAEEILEVAERHKRAGGLDAVSFRDIAAEVGIKSASVHYHFPQKADLGAAVVQRYTARVVETVGVPDDPTESTQERISRLIGVYRSAMIDEGLICLCCVLGAETLDLPDPVAEAVSGFFALVLGWTETALTASPAVGETTTAAQISSSLQGAMILSIATKQADHFATTAQSILDQLSR